MEETIIHTFELSELNELPEVFASLEELYIMLLDLVYTRRYECVQQYQSIIEYCIENNYLVNVQYEISKFTENINQTELIIGCLSVIPTMIASCRFEEAVEFSEALLNDISTEIQDYHLDKLLREKFFAFLKFNKIFSYKQASQKNYLDIIHILMSVAYEGLGEYKNALNSIAEIGELDNSVQLACFRIRFNLIYQQNEDFSVPLFEMSRDSIEEMVESVEFFENSLSLRKSRAKSIFNYDTNLMNYVSTLYIARLHTLLSKFEEANKYYLELQTISPDVDSYEESVVTYLDNFIRYGYGDKGELSLVTKSPLWYYFNATFVRQDIVAEAFTVAEEFAMSEDKQELSAIAYYYMGHLQVMMRNYDQAANYLKKAKELNELEYKYPSELVSVAWLPSMIDFDLLSIMLLTGRPEICQVNQANYFEKEVVNNNITMILSPERCEMAEIMHVLFNLQRKYLEDDLLSTAEVVNLLVKVGMIDEELSPSVTDFCYVKPSINNCQLIAETYFLGSHFTKASYSNVALECNERLEDLIKEFPILEIINEHITKNEQNPLSEQGAALVPEGAAVGQLFIKTSRRKQYLDNIYKFLEKRQVSDTIERRLQIYYKCLIQSPETTEGIANLLPENDILRNLICAYKGLQVETDLEDEEQLEHAIIRAFSMHETNETEQALKSLREVCSDVNGKMEQALVRFSYAKLQFLSGDPQGALCTLELVEPSVSSQDTLYYGALIDKMLLYEHSGDVHEVLRIGCGDTVFKLIKCMVILKHFQFGMPYTDFLPFLEQSCDLELNAFDKAIISAVSQTENAEASDETAAIFEAAVHEIVEMQEEISKVFEHPSTIQIKLNYFCLFETKYDQISPALLPQLSPRSLFYSDLFNKKSTSAFLICGLVTFQMLLQKDSEMNDTLVQEVFQYEELEMDVSWINNFTIFLLKHGNVTFVEGFLSELQQKLTDPVVLSNIELLLRAFSGEVPETDISLSQNPILDSISIKINGTLFGMSIVTLTYPFCLPSIYSRSDFFNPTNQLVLEQITLQDTGRTGGSGRVEITRTDPDTDVSHELSPICGILQLDYHPEKNITVQPVNQANTIEDDATRPPVRAKSARPLLKVPKQVVATKKTKGESLNTRFKRLEPLKDKADEVVIGDKNLSIKENAIRRRLEMPGQDNTERENLKLKNMGEEVVEGEIHTESEVDSQTLPANDLQELPAESGQVLESKNGLVADSQVIDKQASEEVALKDEQYLGEEAVHEQSDEIRKDEEETNNQMLPQKKNPRRKFKASEEE